MIQTIADYAYTLERTYPQLAGAGLFFMTAVAVGLLFTALYFVTRKRVHLLSAFAAVAYVVPFAFR